MLGTTTSLIISALNVAQASRLRQVATDIASDTLDCAISSLNVQNFPTACGEQESLLSAEGYTNIASVTKQNAVYSIEQEVQPGDGSCVAPAGGAPPELLVTEFVTWAPNPTGNWWSTVAYATKIVQESSLVAVSAAALNPNDGSILVKLTDDIGDGQDNVTVNLYAGPPPYTGDGAAVSTLQTGQDGCALFANLVPGQYTVEATEAGWMDSNDDMSGGAPTPFTGAGMSGNVAGGGTLSLPSAAPLYYAQAANVIVTYTPPAGYAQPSGLGSMPLSFFNGGGLVTNPYVAAAATVSPGDVVFPFQSTSPSYNVVPGSCWSNLPSGSVPVPTTGSLTPGGTVTATVSLTPVSVVVQNGGGQLSGAALTATATTVQGAQPNCSASFPMPQLGLGTTSGSTLPAIDATSVTLTSNADPSVFGNLDTFYALVAPATPNASVPTGTVTFTVDGGSPVPVAVQPGGNGNAYAAYQTPTALAVGAHTVNASYSGDGNFSSSTSAAWAQTVSTAGTLDATTTVVTSSADPAKSGNNVTYYATVTPTGGASGVPTGNVTFTVNGTPHAGNALGDGVASYTVTNVAAAQSVAAAYAGDANFLNSSSGTFSETVAASANSTTTSLSSSPNPTVSGGAVTFTATVSPGSPATGVPDGTVTFKDGATTWATVPLSNGTANYTDPALSGAPTQNITAVYNPPVTGANFTTSTGAYAQSVINEELLSSLPYGDYLISAIDGAQNSANTGQAVVVAVQSTGITAYTCTGGAYVGNYYTGAGVQCNPQASGPVYVTVQ